MVGRLLTEAVALADAAYSDDSARAEARGWLPLTEADLGPVPTFDSGIQKSTVGTEGGEKFETVAHAYVGEIDGETTVALAFRGTDQGGRELLFEIGQEDYYAEHRELVDAVMRYAGEGLWDGTVDRVLVTGHSLGGMLAEETAARGLNDPLVREKATVVTFGSPGSSEEVPSDVQLLNLIHTDDPVADIRGHANEVPDWLQHLLPGDFEDAIDDPHREGEDLKVDRAEGRPLEQSDIDDLFEVLYDLDDWNEEPFLVEHKLDLYAQTAAELESGTQYASVTSDQGLPDGWFL